MVNKIGEKLFIDLDAQRLWRLRRRVHAWCTIASKWSKEGARLIMITLTYAPGKEWKSGDISKFLKTLRSNCKTDIMAYAWVGELQERGAVHFHVLVYTKGYIPAPDSMGWWPYGLTRVEVARTAFYLLVHTGKSHQKEFSKYPKGMRAFGVWTSKEIDKAELHMSIFPVWVEVAAREKGEAEAMKEWEVKKRESGWRYRQTIVINKAKEIEPG